MFDPTLDGYLGLSPRDNPQEAGVVIGYSKRDLAPAERFISLADIASVHVLFSVAEKELADAPPVPVIDMIAEALARRQVEITQEEPVAPSITEAKPQIIVRKNIHIVVVDARTGSLFSLDFDRLENGARVVNRHSPYHDAKIAGLDQRSIPENKAIYFEGSNGAVSASSIISQMERHGLHGHEWEKVKCAYLKHTGMKLMPETDADNAIRPAGLIVPMGEAPAVQAG